MRFYLPILAAGALAAGACADNAAPTNDLANGRDFDLNIAALTLDGVKDAVWDIKVENGAAQTVFTARITSSGYGDSAGSASYVGTCDATNSAVTGTCNTTTNKCENAGIKTGDDCTAANEATNCATNVNQNRVTVNIRGIYSGPQTLAGGQLDYNGAVPTSLDFQNPGNLSQVKLCSENGDTFFDFNVALMRPAQQGFFDIAVNFNDIFCSAKYDCASGDLLHDSTNARKDTHVIGLACAAGRESGVKTKLLVDNVKITCGDATNNDVTTVVLGSNEGNLCTAAAASSAATVQPSCGGKVTFASNGTGTGDTPIYQAAIYKGLENAAVGYNVVYWNVALGMKDGVNSAANGFTDCSLSFDATADDAAATTLVLGGDDIDDGQVYPFIHFSVPSLSACSAGGYEHQLNTCLDPSANTDYPTCASGTPAGPSGVATVYTTTTDGANYGHDAFQNVYNPNP